MIFNQIPYQRPLIIGTGGGNDIVSSTLVLSDFIRGGKDADLAGLCSPGAFHMYGRKAEKPVNIVTSETKRFIPSRTRKDLSLIDARVPELLRAEELHADVYQLSCRYGTSRLIDALRDLVRTNGYDGIIAVDVGGDILARGKKDSTILSPLMDFTTLYVLGQLETPSTLIEFGLQTDGELRPDGCREILEELESSGMLLGTTHIEATNPSVRLFERIYRGVEQIRHGHTAHMTLQTLVAKEDIHTDYRMRVQALDRKWTHSFPIILEKEYFGKAFLIDSKKLAHARPLAFQYGDLLELYLRTKQIVDTKTEMDLLYHATERNTLWLGLLCPQITGSQRKEVIGYGLDNLNVHANSAILWKKDSEAIPTNLIREEVDDFIVVGSTSENVVVSALKVKKALGGKNE